jgi:hypothetical protein
MSLTFNSRVPKVASDMIAPGDLVVVDNNYRILYRTAKAAARAEWTDKCGNILMDETALLVAKVSTKDEHNLDTTVGLLLTSKGVLGWCGLWSMQKHEI